MEALVPRAAPNTGPPTYRPIDLMAVDLAIDRRDDGTILLRSRVPISDHDKSLSRGSFGV